MEAETCTKSFSRYPLIKEPSLKWATTLVNFHSVIVPSQSPLFRAALSPGRLQLILLDLVQQSLVADVQLGGGPLAVPLRGLQSLLDGAYLSLVLQAAHQRFQTEWSQRRHHALGCVHAIAGAT